MAIITDIVEQKRNRERYNIYIDYEYAFSLSAELLFKYDIKKGSTIDEIELKKLISEENTKKAYNMSLNYLKYRMRSQKEIEDYLKRKGFDLEDVESVIERLKEYDFIDDEAFANALMRDIISSKPVGRKMIAYKLKQKGVPNEIIDMTLEQIDDEEEFLRAKELAQKQYRRYGGFPTKKDLHRIGRTMARRGFDWDIINRVLRETGEEYGDNL
ncbi:MAG TPA: hypothetical protein GX392_06890 [Clostridiales bacterium]|nr:hypothetical protein [Clostridiales bacterium]